MMIEGMYYDKNKGMYCIDLEAYYKSRGGKYYTMIAACKLPGGPFICPTKYDGDCNSCELRRKIVDQQNVIQ